MKIGELSVEWNEHHENEEDSLHIEGSLEDIDISMSQLEAIIRVVNKRYPGFSDRVGKS